jgi:NAD(P)-dependent dehydrogenase (short-subunit alcohol dehydrogenase family)
MLPEHTLKDRVAVITGGGTGLGRAMAKEFARLGAALVLASRSPEHLEPTAAELRSGGARVLAVPTDVRDPQQVDRLLAETLRQFGRADILVNNAAGNFICRAEELSPNGWRAVVDIVLNGTFFCSRAFGREMIARGEGGAILNILATYAWTGGPGTVHSASAKAGVLAMTRTLAVEWARHRIRVNAIAPGAIPTEGAWGALLNQPEAERRALEHIPLGRFGTQEELANAAAYLVSPYAAYITGEALTMDGGSWLGRGFLQFQKA